MKMIRDLERKWFPKDSPFQRVRRRYAILFGAAGVVLLIWGVVMITTKLSNMSGRNVENAHTKVPLPSLDER
jgi:hypothetical protein